MSLRLLGYLTKIFTAHHKAHGFPLPAVIPFVLHQGPERWSVSTAFEDQCGQSLKQFCSRWELLLLASAAAAGVGFCL
jgi:Putative transposase, YhgA-like